MPVLEKDKALKIYDELLKRCNHLVDCVKPRELNSPCEGLSRGSWNRPENKMATTGTALQISLAVEDFKSILSEIKKIKD